MGGLLTLELRWLQVVADVSHFLALGPSNRNHLDSV
jgi:hypothetical protein